MDQVHKIYLDMDGVLADFDRGVRELCHMEPLDQMHSTPEQNDVLWAAIRKVPHFYDRLEPMPGSIEMVLMLRQWFGNRVEILTGIPKPKRGITTAAEDKIAWVWRNLSRDIRVNIVYRADKPVYCHGKSDILVDDYAKNITEWETSGGTGFLFSSAEDIQKKLWCMAVREKYHLEKRGIWREESDWSQLISGFRYNIISSEWNGTMYDVVNTSFADDYMYPSYGFELVDDVPGENGDWDLLHEIFELSVISGSAWKIDLQMMLDTLTEKQRAFLSRQCSVDIEEMKEMDYQILYDRVYMPVSSREMDLLSIEEKSDEYSYALATLSFGLIIVLENMADHNDGQVS